MMHITPMEAGFVLGRNAKKPGSYTSVPMQKKLSDNPGFLAMLLTS